MHPNMPTKNTSSKVKTLHQGCQKFSKKKSRCVSRLEFQVNFRGITLYNTGKFSTYFLARITQVNFIFWCLQNKLYDNSSRFFFLNSRFSRATIFYPGVLGVLSGFTGILTTMSIYQGA